MHQGEQEQIVPLPDLDMLETVSPAVALHISNRNPQQASSLAARSAAADLSDLAVAELAAGHLEPAVELLKFAVQRFPESRYPFHNLLAALLASTRLRGANLDRIVEYLVSNAGRHDWLTQYRRVIYMPTFLNIEFVEGKCNLHCRMCVGRNSPSYPDRLSCMSPEDFEQMLKAAPTVGGVTLSSNSSDPLLHPQMDQILAIARTHQVTADLYTNGHALTESKCHQIVESQSVQMINVSIDAATATTYKRIRGADLNHVLSQVERLRALRDHARRPLPWLSFSFVAMADNIQELPDFIRMAQKAGALRVYVEDLIGGSLNFGGNRRPTDHPHWRDFVRSATELAGQAHIILTLPDRLTRRQTGKGDEPLPGQGPIKPASALEGSTPGCCCWLRGVWVRMQGRLDPCCVVGGVADLGSIHDGPLFRNDKYARVKELLMSGKVFRKCFQSPCRYVQQCVAAGTPPEVITPEDLGEATSAPTAEALLIPSAV
jgi:MoaA/NifB/PqqE/SkfB family radical SAM enzyme